jgi:hypothetical protein
MSQLPTRREPRIGGGAVRVRDRRDGAGQERLLQALVGSRGEARAFDAGAAWVRRATQLPGVDGHCHIAHVILSYATTNTSPNS